MAKKKKTARPASRKPVKKAAKKPAKKAAPKKKSAKPVASKTAPAMPPEGSVIWMGLNTPDQQASARFYREVLRLSSKLVPMGEQSMMILSSGKTDIAHVSEMIEDRGPRWMAFFYVKDVDAAAQQAAKSGGKIQVPPTDIAEGRFCVMLDPHGIEFAVFKPS